MGFDASLINIYIFYKELSSIILFSLSRFWRLGLVNPFLSRDFIKFSLLTDLYQLTMSYGYWNGAPHVTCDNDCNKGYPTDKVHYQGGNWKYILKWSHPEDVVNNSVEFLTGAL